MKAILLFTLLLASTFAFTIDQIVTDDGKVKIDFYYESLCPYCQQFIQRSLKPASETKDFWKICDFNLYPYGNARRVQNGSTWSFTCQHGERQCQGNLIETCAIKKYDLYTKALPFIICLESNTNDWISSGKRCAQNLGLNWNEIYQCSTSAQGNGYEVEMAQKTEVLNPPHKYVPWVVVNNEHTDSGESGVISNMVRYVCSIYKGPIQIDACK